MVALICNPSTLGVRQQDQSQPGLHKTLSLKIMLHWLHVKNILDILG